MSDVPRGTFDPIPYGTLVVTPRQKAQLEAMVRGTRCPYQVAFEEAVKREVDDFVAYLWKRLEDPWKPALQVDVVPGESCVARVKL